MPRRVRHLEPQPEIVNCAEPDCPATIKRSKWDKIKSEWFFQKDGNAWCGDHIPEWVEQWRMEKMIKQGRET